MDEQVKIVDAPCPEQIVQICSATSKNGFPCVYALTNEGRIFRLDSGNSYWIEEMAIKPMLRNQVW